MTRKEILAKIDLAFGGMVAEELINGEENLSTGPMGDLQGASDLARQYVKYFGMSSLGFSQYTGGEYNNPDGRPAEQTRAKIDEEVEKLLRNSYERAKQCIYSHKRELEYLANALMEHETLNQDQVRKVILGEEIPLTPEQLRAKEKEEELERKKKNKEKSSSGSGWGFLGLGSKGKDTETSSSSSSGQQRQKQMQQDTSGSVALDKPGKREQPTSSPSSDSNASSSSPKTKTQGKEPSSGQTPTAQTTKKNAAKPQPAPQEKEESADDASSKGEHHDHKDKKDSEKEIPEGATETPRKGKRRWS